MYSQGIFTSEAKIFHQWSQDVSVFNKPHIKITLNGSAALVWCLSPWIKDFSGNIYKVKIDKLDLSKMEKKKTLCFFERHLGENKKLSHSMGGSDKGLYPKYMKNSYNNRIDNLT